MVFFFGGGYYSILCRVRLCPPLRYSSYITNIIFLGSTTEITLHTLSSMCQAVSPAWAPRTGQAGQQLSGFCTSAFFCPTLKPYIVVPIKSIVVVSIFFPLSRNNPYIYEVCSQAGPLRMGKLSRCLWASSLWPGQESLPKARNINA